MSLPSPLLNVNSALLCCVFTKNVVLCSSKSDSSKCGSEPYPCALVLPVLQRTFFKLSSRVPRNDQSHSAYGKFRFIALEKDLWSNAGYV